MTTLQQFIDAAGVTARQRLFVAVLILVMVADGLDMTIVSHIFPSLVREWGVTSADITLIVTGGAIGMGIGALAAGPASYRWGRKAVTIAGVVVFSIGTAALAAAPDVGTLTAIRIFACIGVGAVTPIALTYVAELVPSARRAAFVTIALAGVPLGSIVGAYLAAGVIPSSGGWRLFAVVGGLLPIVCVVLLAAVVPESPLLLASRRAPEQVVRRRLSRLLPGLDASSVDLAVGPDPATIERNGFRELVSRRLVVTTVLLWFYAFFGQGLQQLVNQYLPTLLQAPDPGLDTVQSSLVVAMLSWGALAGSAVLFFVLARVSRFVVDATLLALGVVCLLVMSAGGLGFEQLLIAAFLLGTTFTVGISFTGTLAAIAYPVRVRSQGVGTANFVGRLGTIANTAVGGALIGAGWMLSGMLALIAVPTAALIATTFGLAADSRRRRRTATAEELESASF